MQARVEFGSLLRVLACVGAAYALALASSPDSTRAASSSLTVTYDVRSNTTIDATSCGSGSLGTRLLALGAVQAGSKAASGTCAITFGSSNDTSSLRVSQQDCVGSTMWSFGNGSLATTWQGSGYAGYTGAGDHRYSDVEVLRDGRILAVGPGANLGPFLVSRFLEDGSPDLTFDGDSGTSDGHVLVPALEAGAATPWRVRVDELGRILILIDTYPGAPVGFEKIRIVRLESDGSLDTSWGGDGMVTIDPTANDEQGRDMALQPDGKIVVVGCTHASNCSGPSDKLLLRIGTNGALDPTFGAGGVVIQDDSPGGVELLDAVTLDDAGRIVAGGFDVTLEGYVARYTTTGALDTASFAAPNGYLAIGGGAGASAIWDLTILPDGRIAAGGNEFGAATNWLAARLTSSGTLDATFASGGIAVVDMLAADDGGAYDIQQLGDGRLLLAGSTGPGLFPLDMGTAMLRTDGTLDTTWSGDGRDERSLIAGMNTEGAGAAALARDGRLVIAGHTTDGGGDVDALLMMYEHGSPVADYQDGVADWDTMPATSAFGACLDSVSGGASAIWTASVGCPQTDGAWWQAVPASATTVATAASGNQTAVATLRFGSRASNSLAPGTYVARVAFDVVAPSV